MVNELRGYRGDNEWNVPAGQPPTEAAWNHDGSTPRTNYNSAESRPYLPEMSIGGTTGAMGVTEDLVRGGWNEATQHTDRLITSAAISAGVAALARMINPKGAAIAALAFAGTEAYEVWKNSGSWLHSADVVANPYGHSIGEVRNAHRAVRDLGAGTVDVGAGVAGGYAGYKTISLGASLATGIGNAFRGTPEVAQASALQSALEPKAPNPAQFDGPGAKTDPEAAARLAAKLTSPVEPVVQPTAYAADDQLSFDFIKNRRPQAWKLSDLKPIEQS